MEEYKKGDRVRVVSEDGDNAYVGKTGTVVETIVGARWPIRVEFDSAGPCDDLRRSYRAGELELLKVPKGFKPVHRVASNADGLAVTVWSDGTLRFTFESRTLSIGLESLESAVEEVRTVKEATKAVARREAIEFLGIDGTYEEMEDYQKNRVDSVVEIKHGGFV